MVDGRWSGQVPCYSGNRRPIPEGWPNIAGGRRRLRPPGPHGTPTPGFSEQASHPGGVPEADRIPPRVVRFPTRACALVLGGRWWVADARRSVGRWWSGCRHRILSPVPRLLSPRSQVSCAGSQRLGRFLKRLEHFIERSPAVRQTSPPLRQDLVNDLAVDVGEAAIDAAVAEGELGVIEAEEVEDGGVEVVAGGDILGGLP